MYPIGLVQRTAIATAQFAIAENLAWASSSSTDCSALPSELGSIRAALNDDLCNLQHLEDNSSRRIRAGALLRSTSPSRWCPLQNHFLLSSRLP